VRLERIHPCTCDLCECPAKTLGGGSCLDCAKGNHELLSGKQVDTCSTPPCRHDRACAKHEGRGIQEGSA
jgi:hypothetical protein